MHDLLFADDAALVAYSDQDLKTLLGQFSLTCQDFDLTINYQDKKVILIRKN